MLYCRQMHIDAYKYSEEEYIEIARFYKKLENAGSLGISRESNGKSTKSGFSLIKHLASFGDFYQRQLLPCMIGKMMIFVPLVQ